jgi:2-amino-4-hydroxy-6-hydroxymethyldihydropteridine diphosphokinase
MASSSSVVVMLGSNIEPEQNLPTAVHALARLGNVAAVSSVWQTAPVGFIEQADFCNAAVLLNTSLSIPQLLVELRAIEQQLGRIRDPRNKNAPRTIDLDLAVVDQPCTIAGHVFPDPEIANRVFLAVPLFQVQPGFRLADGRPIGQIAAELRARDGERLRLVERTDLILSIPGERPASAG